MAPPLPEVEEAGGVVSFPFGDLTVAIDEQSKQLNRQSSVSSLEFTDLFSIFHVFRQTKTVASSSNTARRGFAHAV